MTSSSVVMAEGGVDEARGVVAGVVHVHEHEHGQDAGQSPAGLAADEGVGGVVALLRDDGGGGEDHGQADHHQQQRGEEHPFVDAYCASPFLAVIHVRGARSHPRFVCVTCSDDSEKRRVSPTQQSRQSPSAAKASTYLLALRHLKSCPFKLQVARIGSSRRLPDFPAAPLVDQFLEDAAAVLVAFELVEAGAGGREQHHFAGMGGGSCGADGACRAFRRSGAGRRRAGATRFWRRPSRWCRRRARARAAAAKAGCSRSSCLCRRG